MIPVALVFVLALAHGQPSRVIAENSDADATAAIHEPTQFLPAFPDASSLGEGQTLTPVQLLREEVAFLRRRVHELRVLYGASYCSMHRIGPTGGFCLKTRLGGPSAAEHGATNSGSHTDAPLCEALGMLMSGGTVADLGAGRGQYGVCLGPHVLQYKAFDGSEGIETVTDGEVTFLDLSVPTWLGQTFDWVMSVEVGEHIAPSAEGAFISNLLRHVGGGGLVLSWATPGQGGHHHVNERPHDYIIDQVHTMSGGTLHLNSNVTSSLRRLSTLPWFKRNIMVFDRVKPGSSDTVTTAVASRS